MKNNKSIFLGFLAVLSTVLSFYIIDLFIVHITVKQAIGIEIIITLLHYLYNKTKIRIVNS